VTRAPAPAAENPFYWPVASGQSDDVSLSVWHCLNIDDKALLTALSCESPAVAKGGIAKAHLEFTLDETRSCQYKEIASAEADGHRWTWLLVWPKQAGQPVGNDELLVSYRSKRGGGLHLGSDVIRLREDRFNAMLKEIQRLSKTHVPGSAEPFSLDTLRAQLNGR
jgi:hypothetical protein